MGGHATSRELTRPHCGGRIGEMKNASGWRPAGAHQIVETALLEGVCHAKRDSNGLGNHVSASSNAAAPG